MDKKASNKWKAVKLEGAILNDLEGLVGIEELVNYETQKDEVNHEKNTRKEKKIKTNKKLEKKIKTKKITKQHYVIHPDRLVQIGKTERKKKIGEGLDENVNKVNDLSNWLSFGIAEPILKALADLGFQQPTKIQEKTLHAAILGHRDILGAAETGSGKTLAFGIPILCGIISHKQKLGQEIANRNVQTFLKHQMNEDNFSDEEDEKDKIGENIENEDEFDWEEDIEIDEDIKPLDSNELGLVKSIDNIKFDNNDQRNNLFALIITPTRELAVQINQHLLALAKYTNIRIGLVVGGMSIEKQQRILDKKRPEIVVCTPGRLWHLIQLKQINHFNKIDQIKYFAIDETDRMLEKGHFEELHQLLELLNQHQLNRTKRQNFLFSATLTLTHDLPKYLKGRRNMAKMTPQQKLQKIIEILGVTNPKVCDITNQSGTAENLTESRIICGDLNEKDYYLYYFILRHPARTIIFCNSIGCVKRLATLFSLLLFDQRQILPLHAQMQQKQRLKNLERFRDKENSILIATDVAARGLDIPKVDHVIHYQVPRTAEMYVHRSGRTARGINSSGITVLIMEPSELQFYRRLCRTLEKAEDLPLFPVNDNILSVLKERVNLARDIDKLELKVRKENKQNGWLTKAVREMDIIVDDARDLEDFDDERELKSNVKKALYAKRAQLKQLISKPVLPKGFSGRYPTSSGEIDIPLVQGKQKETNAIEVMKQAKQNYQRTHLVHRLLNKVQKRKPLKIKKNKTKKQKTNEQINKNK